MTDYVGTYRVFAPLDLSTNKVTTNTYDTYLLGKYQIQCYRIKGKTLALYLPTGKNSANIILPQFDLLGIKYELHIEGDYELVYTFNEKDIEGVHSVVKFQTKGKNLKPKSKSTTTKQIKKLS